MKSGKNRPDRKGRKPRALSRTVRTSEKLKPKAAKGKARKGARSPKLDPRRRNPAAFPGGAGLLAAIVQSSDAAIIGKTLDGIVTSWNPSAEKIFGYSEAEMIGKPVNVIASPDRPEEMSEILERIRRGERVEQFQTQRRRKDGRLIHVSLTVSPILDESGRIVGASKIARDITARKITEDQLRAKTTQLEEFTHALNLVPAMVRTQTGEILFWGHGLQILYGWSAAEAAGRISHELLATEFPLPRAEIEAELRERGEWQGELQHTHKDGRRLIVESQWTLHGTAGENPESILDISFDLTEMKQAQSMIEEREARLRSILETAPDAIITIDERGIIQSFSTAAEKLLGYAAGEVIGHNIKMLMPSPHREDHDAYLARHLHTGEKRIIGIGREVEAQRKDGTIFPIELAVGKVKLGGPSIFTGFIRDLTARVKMEQDLRQAQKMEAIGQLTGGVAHDFNNLLTVISGNLEMLERRLSRAEDREILKEAQEASQLGAELSKRLLAFGRRQSLDPKPTDLNALVSGMVDLLRRSLGATIEIETRLAKGLPLVMVDAGQVENALLNLAVNARDAMPDGGRLIIESRLVDIDNDYLAQHPDATAGRHVMLAVTDTGTGMSPKVREHAFEPFYTTKAPGAGSGLGLSMVYGFVKQSGGHVQLYSELGHGTTIRLYLPARGEGAGAAEVAADQALASASGERILVVEDDPRVRRVAVRRLKELGYVTVEAESGPAALRLLEGGHPFDLLFTDVVMGGGLSGIELAEEARRRQPKLKVLFTSGYAEPAVAKRGLRSVKSAAWLSKPYSTSGLQAKLREVLDR